MKLYIEENDQADYESDSPIKGIEVVYNQGEADLFVSVGTRAQFDDDEETVLAFSKAEGICLAQFILAICQAMPEPTQP